MQKHRVVLAVLASFVVVPIASAWLLPETDDDHRGPLGFTKSSKPAFGNGHRNLKKSFIRKALLPKRAAPVQLTQVNEKLPEPITRICVDAPLLRPCFTNRLDFCAEFTKPASLQPYQAGTPESHRHPPA